MQIYRYVAQRQGYNGDWYFHEGYTIAENEDKARINVEKEYDDFDIQLIPTTIINMD